MSSSKTNSVINPSNNTSTTLISPTTPVNATSTCNTNLNNNAACNVQQQQQPQQQQQTFDIYCSYQLANKKIVTKICDLLIKRYNFKISMDKLQIGTVVNDELKTKINNSKLFLCFLTTKYCQSTTCIQELCYANQFRKKIICVLLENIDFKKLLNHKIALFINNSLKCNAFKESKCLNEWPDHLFQELIYSIYKALFFKQQNEFNFQFDMSTQKAKELLINTEFLREKSKNARDPKNTHEDEYIIDLYNQLESSIASDTEQIDEIKQLKSILKENQVQLYENYKSLGKNNDECRQQQQTSLREILSIIRKLKILNVNQASLAEDKRENVLEHFKLVTRKNGKPIRNKNMQIKKQLEMNNRDENDKITLELDLLLQEHEDLTNKELYIYNELKRLESLSPEVIQSKTKPKTPSYNSINSNSSNTNTHSTNTSNRQHQYQQKRNSRRNIYENRLATIKENQYQSNDKH